MPNAAVLRESGHSGAFAGWRLRERVRGPNGLVAALKPCDLDLGRAGVAVASFSAPTAGRYLVSARAAEPGARIAVGGNLGRGMLLTDLAGCGVGFAALAAVATIVVLVLRRGRRPAKVRRS